MTSVTALAGKVQRCEVIYEYGTVDGTVGGQPNRQGEWAGPGHTQGRCGGTAPFMPSYGTPHPVHC